ncbi:MAG: GDSL family lipase [Bacteroidetes bacterium]|nr:GDSL family lipase [Fibrella sp.]
MTWYEDEVHLLEQKINSLPPADDRMVFYGSSSIRLWKTLATDFSDSNTLNLGFGGSTLAACTWFFERLIVPAQPASIVLYAGDNDLGDGHRPQEVYLYFCEFMDKMQQHFPEVPVSFLAIKTSIARWNLRSQIYLANQLIEAETTRRPNCRFIDMMTPLLGDDGAPRRAYFEPDGLHLSPAGYAVWQRTLQPYLVTVNNLVK